MRRVILESPYGAETDAGIRANIDYARICVRDCLSRGDAPIASHLLFTQPNILDDRVPSQRDLGMRAGWEWMVVAEAVVVYEDYGISKGMQLGIEHAENLGIPVEHRTLSEQASVGLINAKYRTA